MRIGLVSYEYPPDVGGEATYTRSLAVGLARLGHEVLLVIPERTKAPELFEEPGVKKMPVRILDVPMFKVGSFMLGARRELGRLNVDRRIDIVHLTFDYPSLPLPMSGLDVPTLTTVHHLHLVEALSMLKTSRSLSAALPTLARGFFTTMTERVVLSRADSIIAVSRFTKDSLVKYAGVAADEVRVVPNGIDMDPFLNSADRGTLRKRFGLGTKPIVLFVGRLGASKGLEVLIRAFGESGSRLAACLLIVGSGSTEYSAQLRRLSSSLGLGDRVVFTGRLDQADLNEAYAASAVVVLPSLMEGFGMSVLEAMASGRPCIATRVGAVPEIVLPSRAGLLVPPGDSDALSKALQEVLGDPGEARRMGDRGREFANSEFTAERMVERTLAVYFELLGRK